MPQDSKASKAPSTSGSGIGNPGAGQPGKSQRDQGTTKGPVMDTAPSGGDSPGSGAVTLKHFRKGGGQLRLPSLLSSRRVRVNPHSSEITFADNAFRIGTRPSNRR